LSVWTSEGVAEELEIKRQERCEKSGQSAKKTTAEGGQ
jgi:hypothetical protein